MLITYVIGLGRVVGVACLSVVFLYDHGLPGCGLSGHGLHGRDLHRRDL